jgi:hypothetical protein
VNGLYIENGWSLFHKHDSKILKLVHKFILLLEFDFLPTYLLHFKKGFRSFPLF